LTAPLGLSTNLRASSAVIMLCSGTMRTPVPHPRCLHRQILHACMPPKPTATAGRIHTSSWSSTRLRSITVTRPFDSRTRKHPSPTTRTTSGADPSRLRHPKALQSSLHTPNDRHKLPLHHVRDRAQELHPPGARNAIIAARLRQGSDSRNMPKLIGSTSPKTRRIGPCGWTCQSSTKRNANNTPS